MTQEEAEAIAATIPTEVGDLVTCPDCDSMHDAQVVPCNGSGPQLTIRCGEKIIFLER